MKKSIVLLIIALSFLLLMGCSKIEVKRAESEIESLIGYIVIKENTLYFDKAVIIEPEDKEMIKKLSLDENLQPTGFVVYNEIQEEVTYELEEEVKYTFFIIESEGNKLYNTTKKEEFLKHLADDDLNYIPLFEQTIPYFVEVQNGKVIRITEEIKLELKFTI